MPHRATGEALDLVRKQKQEREESLKHSVYWGFRRKGREGRITVSNWQVGLISAVLGYRIGLWLPGPGCIKAGGIVGWCVLDKEGGWWV